MSTYYKVTKEKWEQVKKLKSAGVFSQIEIAKIVGISDASVSNCARANTYEEYQALVRSYATAKKKAQEIREARDSVARAVYQNELENVKNNVVNKDFTEAQLDRIIELLVENNKKLTQLAELWGMPRNWNPIQSIRMHHACWRECIAIH